MSETAEDAVGGGRIEIVDHQQERFYELTVDGVAAGMLVYESKGSRRVLTHTTIRESYRGRGLSGRLIHHVLDDLRAKKYTITNYCAAVDRFIEIHHPEFAALIDRDRPGSWPQRRPAAQDAMPAQDAAPTRD